MNFKNTITAVILFFTLIIGQSAYSQTNYSDIKVDDLTDTQIRQLIQRAEAVGYNDVQLEQMAAAQGMKAQEIQKLRLRVEKIRKTDKDSSAKDDDKNKNSTDDSSDRDSKNQDGRTYNDGKSSKDGRTSKDDNQKDGKGADKQLSSADSKKAELEALFQDLKPKIFGAELFKNADMTFEPNLRMATPRSYIIGPDDELLIDLTGDNEANYKLKVSPEGTIRLQYVGLLGVGGLSIDQAIAKIKTGMAKTYPGLKSGRTNVSINLGNIRSIKITLLGEVTKPGSYTLSSLSTVFNALNASGGPNENGSYRNIQVIRNNKQIAVIDIYDFLLNGIQKGNVRLQDQDVINIPVYQSRVEMVGEVKRPAFFEVLSTESLEDVLRFAGGFSYKAYTANIKVLQNTNKERKISDVAAEKFSSYGPLNGDKYIVESILDRFENRVEIIGAVFRPGQFSLDKGLTLKGLISKADGLKEDAFLNRGYISRLNLDNTLSLLSFDVEKILNGSETDIPLQREDKVTISSIFDLRDEYKVSIQGEVRAPGSFDYADNMNLEDLIQMAGGFKEGATPNRIEISRRVKNSDALSKSAATAELLIVNVDEHLKLRDSSFTLKPFDIVSIRSSKGYEIQKQVKLEGEVLYPGVYTITKKNDRISDLIKRAGGLTSSAYPEGAYLKRPGPNEVKTGDKNAIDNKEEDKLKMHNLKRLQEVGATDTTNAVLSEKILSSDLVGISLDRILAKPGERFDLFVEDGDIIRVPKQLQTVKVTGEVLSPNSIVFASGRGFKSYINGAGGYTYNAYKKGTHIRYANGSVESVRKVLFFNNYPKVKPGSEILVPKRAEREKMTVQGWIGISTALASLAAIFITLIR